ncbi:hypothetical protein QBC38DRAFT_488359 [Podospora fimiseda]|uniref:Uncharacterized protein n=1 Tax=Podospora fimiseda TaxID=252190 RepID=A0AAN7GTZ8_9PEZI|nr:hypothetical protein QBC38DRAFT_488359 [Podospora fimiseda]
MPPPPTATLPKGFSQLLTARQATTTVIVDNNNNNGGGGGGKSGGLDAGAIVGIVLGTIAGILLLWWIIRVCSQPRDPRGSGGPRPRDDYYEEPIPRRSRSRSASRHSRGHRHHHHHGHSSSRRRSTSRPVVLQEEKAAYGVPVAAPAAVYYSGDLEGRRGSRSRSRGRYYEGY